MGGGQGVPNGPNLCICLLMGWGEIFKDTCVEKFDLGLAGGSSDHVKHVHDDMECVDYNEWFLFQVEEI